MNYSKRTSTIRNISILLAAVVALVMGYAGLAGAMTTDSIDVRVKGVSGVEQVELQVNGVVVDSWVVSDVWETQSFVPVGELVIDSVEVHFVNDGAGRDVRVDWVEVAGVGYESEALETTSLGSWKSADGCAEGNKSSEWLHCNGWMRYPVPAGTTIGEGPGEPPVEPTDSIDVRVKGVSGVEQVELQVNGVVVDSWVVSDVWETQSFVPVGELVIDSVEVHFVNDGAGRDVRVDWVEVAGVGYESEALETTSLGSWKSADGCAEGNKSSEWLHCNGWMRYPVPAGTTIGEGPGEPPVEPPVEPQGSELVIRAKGVDGAERIGLQINRGMVATWPVTTDWELYTWTAPEGTDITGLDVLFMNNASGRDVAIDYVQVDETKYESEEPGRISLGSWSAGSGCGEGAKESEWLHCNGWIRYITGDAPPPPPAVVGDVVAYDSAWEIPTYASPAEIDDYFDHLVARGFDGVFLSLLNHTDGRINGKNGLGQKQWNEIDGDIVVTDEHIQHMLTILDQAEARGLRVGFVPIWGASYLNHSWAVLSCNNGHLTLNNSYAIGRQIGDAFANHPAIEFWILGGDNLCHKDGQVEDVNIWRNVVQGLEDGGATQEMTYHTTSGSVDRYFQVTMFATEPWVDFLFPQTGHCHGGDTIPNVVNKLEADFGKNVFASETRYYESGSDDWCDKHPSTDRVNADDITEDVTAALTADILGIAYGDWNRWNWCTATTSGRLPYNDPCGPAGIETTLNTPGEDAFLTALNAD